MSKKSNIQRTLDWLRMMPDVEDIEFTERKIPHTLIKKDLYGIIDLVVLVKNKANWLLWGIQVCGGNDYAAHMKKMLASQKAYKWVYGIDRRLILVGWRELKKGWRPRCYRFTRGDWRSIPPSPPTSKYSTPKVDRL